MPRATESFDIEIPGPSGRLEALLELPGGDPQACAVVCHPHPLHGGTMHNKVAHTLARAFLRSGHATLRFNFRGTGKSEGEHDNGIGECEDALAALHWLSERYADLPVWLAGFSFGAAMAVRAASQVAVDGLVSVAPAITRFASGMTDQPACPWLIVQGDSDELVPIEETVDWVDGLDLGPELLVFENGEHFFHGRLVELREAVMAFVAANGRQ